MKTADEFNEAVHKMFSNETGAETFPYKYPTAPADAMVIANINGQQWLLFPDGTKVPKLIKTVVTDENREITIAEVALFASKDMEPVVDFNLKGVSYKGRQIPYIFEMKIGTHKYGETMVTFKVPVNLR